MQLGSASRQTQSQSVESLKRQIQWAPLQRSQKENVMKFNPIAQSSIAILSLLFVPVHSFATTPTPATAPFCIAVNGGWGQTDGSTYVARNFTLPDANKCTPFAGYTKTSATVIFTTNGTACVSSDNKALTVSVTSADPDFLGVGAQAADYIKMARTNTTAPFTGSDAGYLMGSAEQTTCAANVLTLPDIHD
jgi:hypothetical protein